MANKKLRERGDTLVDQGCFLGDTSGRTKQLEEKSVFSICSRSAKFSVKFSAAEKQKVFRKLKKRHKDYGEERVKTIMHAVNIYFAVKGFVKTASKFYICSDGFTPRQLTQEVKALLDVEYSSKKFNFKSLREKFGKHNIADKLASNVRNGKESYNLLLKESHFKKLKLI